MTDDHMPLNNTATTRRARFALIAAVGAVLLLAGSFLWSSWHPLTFAAVASVAGTSLARSWYRIGARAHTAALFADAVTFVGDAAEARIRGRCVRRIKQRPGIGSTRVMVELKAEATAPGRPTGRVFIIHTNKKMAPLLVNHLHAIRP